MDKDKLKLTFGIYCWRNKVNNKVYVGQTDVNFYERCINGERKILNNGNYDRNTHFQRSWNKYGEENFELIILEEHKEHEQKEYLSEREQFWMDKYNSLNRNCGYNLRASFPVEKHSEETKKKISKSQMGKIVSEKTKRKISETQKEKFKIKENHPMCGKTFSEEHRKKLSKFQKSKIVSEETKKKMSENNAKYWKGRAFSKKHKQKISKSQIGKIISEEHKQKISEANRGENNPNSKLTNIQRAEIIYRFNNEDILQKELAMEYGVDKTTISKIITKNKVNLL